MIKKIYGVYDAKQAIFINFMITENQTNLLRDLKAIVNAENSQNYLALYPEDFALHVIGSIDTDTGKVESVNHEIICEIASLKEK